MPEKKLPTIKPTPLRGKLKDEDIRRAVEQVRDARLKAEAEKKAQAPTR